MSFAPDTERTLRSIVDLLNTSSPLVDLLSTVADLDQYLSAQSFAGPRARNQAELRSIRLLRSQLQAIWTAPVEEAVHRVNYILRNGRALPQLVTRDGKSYFLHAVTESAPLYDRMAVTAGVALAEVISADGLDRLRICASQDCHAALLDLSRNNSKRYCDTGNCANREHVRAYRARKAAK
ncbi:CGNR zinc finger domain-containing protein [Glutamicibacter endophyticus]|uniref:CGNR zinc finger domain-containing protein n=1 Tax=Glutamicibacter endophyticus TaxID=1522174 RepID=UPI003AF17B2A